MCDERFWRGRPQSHSNSFKYLNQECSSATARIKDDYTWVCEARGNTKVLTKRIVDPRNHIFDDLWRRVPYTQFFSEFWIKRLQERLIEILNGLALVKGPEELASFDPIQNCTGCV